MVFLLLGWRATNQNYLVQWMINKRVSFYCIRIILNIYLMQWLFYDSMWPVKCKSCWSTHRLLVLWLSLHQTWAQGQTHLIRWVKQHVRKPNNKNTGLWDEAGRREKVIIPHGKKSRRRRRERGKQSEAETQRDNWGGKLLTNHFISSFPPPLTLTDLTSLPSCCAHSAKYWSPTWNVTKHYQLG